MIIRGLGITDSHMVQVGLKMYLHFFCFFEALSVIDGLNGWICGEKGDINLMGIKNKFLHFGVWYFLSKK